jgi:hypothetical protein
VLLRISAHHLSRPTIEHLAGAGRLLNGGRIRGYRDHLALADEPGQTGPIVATGEGLVITLHCSKADQDGESAKIGLPTPGTCSERAYLERDDFRLNRRGSPNRLVSDSTCRLGKEASMDGATVFG